MLSSKAYPALTHPEGRQHPQVSVHSGGYPPYAEGYIPFPGPYQESSSVQRSSTGHPTGYVSTSPTTSQSTVGLYQQERQNPYAYHSAGGSSGGHRTYPAASSIAGGADLYARSEVQTNPGPDYTVTNAQTKSQDWDANVYHEGHQDSDFLQKGPTSNPAAVHSERCAGLRVLVLLLMSSS